MKAKSTAKNIGLYDVDSKIPNLALMKLSTYHKSIGDYVNQYLPILHDEFDKIYASKIFNFSDGSYITPDMIVGGTGSDKLVNLTEEIERLIPDYSLYGYPHSIGFTQRGCRLKCKFCVVPEKEGRVVSNNTIDEIWTQRDSNFIVLLDNDFFGNPEWSDRIEEIKEYKLKVNFSQGLNVRILTEEQAVALKSVNFRNLHDTARQVYFAWDDPRHEKLIHKGIKLCLDVGIKPYQMAFYVLIGFHSTPEEDLHRVEILREYGCDPYSMPYDKKDPYQKRFTRWVNHKAIFKTVPWGEYLNSTVKAKKKDNLTSSLSL